MFALRAVGARAGTRLNTSVASPLLREVREAAPPQVGVALLPLVEELKYLGLLFRGGGMDGQLGTRATSRAAMQRLPGAAAVQRSPRGSKHRPASSETAEMMIPALVLW